MITAWYVIVSMMLIIYVVLDGRNFGAGILHRLAARTPQERRQVIAAISPLWSWHEVWLVGFGGILMAVFPRLMASAFSGYYLALFLILWCLIMRGVSIEVGGHTEDRLWQELWDFAFSAANLLLAVLLGTAAGNVGRGVPIDVNRDLSMPSSLTSTCVARWAFWIGTPSPSPSSQPSCSPLTEQLTLS
jgi:cytochrome d ubiquinol oxidase subunit II